MTRNLLLSFRVGDFFIFFKVMNTAVFGKTLYNLDLTARVFSEFGSKEEKWA